MITLAVLIIILFIFTSYRTWRVSLGHESGNKGLNPLYILLTCFGTCIIGYILLTSFIKLIVTYLP